MTLTAATVLYILIPTALGLALGLGLPLLIASALSHRG